MAFSGLVASTLSFPPAPAQQEKIDRRANLSYREFVNDYRNAGKPVIFTDLSKDWPALGKFTPSYFREEHGHRPVTIGNKTYLLGEFLDLLAHSTRENPAPYPCKLDVRGDYADLTSHIVRPQLTLPDRTHSRLVPRRFVDGLADLEVFIGGPGGEFPYLHYDYLGFYAYINQLYGEKEFFIYPKNQEHLLYIHPEQPWVSRVDNAFRPNLEKFPLFAQAQPIVEVLGPGETLFIPCGTWHTARSKTISISVAFDQLCSSNWSFFSSEVRRSYYPKGWKAAVVKTYLAAAGALFRGKEWLTGWR